MACTGHIYTLCKSPMKVFNLLLMAARQKEKADQVQRSTFDRHLVSQNAAESVRQAKEI